MVSANIDSIAPFPTDGKTFVKLSLSLKENGTSAVVGTLNLSISLQARSESGGAIQDIAVLEPQIRAAARHLLAVAAHRMRKPVL